MKLTPEQVNEQLKEILSEGLNAAGVETDNNGQIIIYTDIYKWSDGSFQTEQEDEDTGVFSVRSILSEPPK